MNTETFNTGIIPGTKKAYSDLAIALAALYKAFHHNTYTTNVCNEFLTLNCYLNTVAKQYGVQSPSEMKEHDSVWYGTAVPVLHNQQEVLELVKSFSIDFGIVDENFEGILDYVSILLPYGLIEYSLN